jgi:hypothetical protein
MGAKLQLSDDELLMGQVAALIESPFEPSEDYVERYKRVTDMSLDQDTVKNLNNLTPEQHRKVRNIIRWQRIGCIVVKISETMNISLKEALDLFYKSETCRRFHDEETGLYLQGNLYVLNDFLAEIGSPA